MLFFKMSVSLDELQSPGASSTHQALDHDDTKELPPPCLIVGKTQLSQYSSPGCCHTCWTPSEPNKFGRPQEMFPVIHALGLLVFRKLFTGILVSQLQKRLLSVTTAIQSNLMQFAGDGLSIDGLTAGMLAALVCPFFFF